MKKRKALELYTVEPYGLVPFGFGKGYSRKVFSSIDNYRHVMTPVRRDEPGRVFTAPKNGRVEAVRVRGVWITRFLIPGPPGDRDSWAYLCDPTTGELQQFSTKRAALAHEEQIPQSKHKTVNKKHMKNTETENRSYLIADLLAAERNKLQDTGGVWRLGDGDPNGNPRNDADWLPDLVARWVPGSLDDPQPSARKSTFRLANIAAEQGLLVHYSGGVWALTTLNGYPVNEFGSAKALRAWLADGKSGLQAPVEAQRCGEVWLARFREPTEPSIWTYVFDDVHRLRRFAAEGDAWRAGLFAQSAENKMIYSPLLHRLLQAVRWGISLDQGLQTTLGDAQLLAALSRNDRVIRRRREQSASEVAPSTRGHRSTRRAGRRTGTRASAG